MKNMRKLFAMVLAVMLVMSLATTGFATMEGSIDGGSIAINDAIVGQTYNAYQILYLESYDADAKAYAYKANSAWSDWLKKQTTYVSVDAQGYVTWTAGTDDATVAAFAKLAQAEAAEMDAADKTVTATSTKVEFTGLKLGYYLVDTTLGTLCALDTTNPSVEMYEKNEEPTIVKKVQEDSDNSWGDSNTAEIGQTVNFKTTVSAKPGAQNYVVHDAMSDGLTFQEVTSVKVGTKTLTKGTDYTVVTTDLCTAADNGSTYGACDFHVVFTQTYLDTITANTDIVIEYTAILNKDAVISTGANTNDTKLDYGEDSETEWDHTDTYAFKFELIKTDSDNKVLDGAKFELYDASTGGNKIALVKANEGVYRVATEAEKSATGFTSAVIETVNGIAVVNGLDANTSYWLEETAAPDGYNKLTTRTEVPIVNSNLTGVVTDNVWQSGGVHVTNQAGAELPSTGGIGTTMFYLIGGIMVAAAVVLLVTKKRMASAE